MEFRETDRMTLDEGKRGVIQIDRKIPLWGVFGVIGAFVVQGALVWSAQQTQAVEMRYQSNQIADLAAQIKAMAEQMATKNGKDIEQDLRLNEMSRRLIILEGASQNRRQSHVDADR